MSWNATAQNLRDCNDDVNSDSIGECALDNFNDGSAFPSSEQIQQLQAQSTSMTVLNNADCIDNFKNQEATLYKSVLFVTNNTDYNSSVLDIYPSGAISTLVNPGKFAKAPRNMAISFNVSTNSTLAHVDYCLAESTSPECTLKFNQTIMIVVMVCNVLKIFSFFATLRVCTTPLVTIGDAIASFLWLPDTATVGYGAVGVNEIHSLRTRTYGDRPGQYIKVRNNNQLPWEQRIYGWYRASSGRRWFLAMVL